MIVCCLVKKWDRVAQATQFPSHRPTLERVGPGIFCPMGFCTLERHFSSNHDSRVLLPQTHKGSVMGTSAPKASAFMPMCAHAESQQGSVGELSVYGVPMQSVRTLVDQDAVRQL
jgi:hypothetical protein